MPFLASKGCFWPPTAFMTSEVKNNYAYVIMEDICNKFIEVNFSVGCKVSRPNRLLQRSTTMSFINKIPGLGNSITLTKKFSKRVNSVFYYALMDLLPFSWHVSG